MPAPYAAALFDLDGTLIDSYAAIHDALNLTLRHFALEPVALHRVRRIVGDGLESLMEKTVGKERQEEGVAIFRKRYAVTGPRMTELLPGADELTAELERRDVVMGVVSNKPSYFSVEILEALGILDRFVIVTGPDEGFAPKPDPAMLFHTLEALEADPEDAILVGDMPVDVRAARAAGVDVAVLPTGSSSRNELLDARADHVFSSLIELLQLFPPRSATVDLDAFFK